MATHSTSAAELALRLRAPEFAAWHATLVALRERHAGELAVQAERDDEARIWALRAEATQRRAAEALFAAGDCEARVEAAEAAQSAAENAAFALLSDFEAARERATDSWQRADAATKELDDLRLGRQALAQELAAARQEDTPAAAMGGERIEGRLREQDGVITRQVGVVAQLQQVMDTGGRDRDALWSAVEAAWARSFAACVERSEQALGRRQARAAAEAAFAQSAREAARAAELRAAAQAQAARARAAATELEALRAALPAQLGGRAGASFAYWMQAEDPTQMWVVPLFDQEAGAACLNLDVAAGAIYRAKLGRGLDFIELLPPQAAADAHGADARLDSFFTAGPRDAPP